MTKEAYLHIKTWLLNNGYAEEIKAIDDLLDGNLDKGLEHFRYEYIWVVVNSGMKNQIAKKIFEKIIDALENKVDLSTVFKHKDKVNAIKTFLFKEKQYYINFLMSSNKVDYLGVLPFIGNITKYHLARNMGIDCVKPDRHLERIANEYNTTPEALCKKISIETGDKLGVVDVVIWRACNLKII